MKNKYDIILDLVFYILLATLAVFCIYPLLLALSVSFSDEYTVVTKGYSLFPQKVSLYTYNYIFHADFNKILNAYVITICITLIGVLASMIVSSLYAYALSVKEFKYRNIFAFICYFTMIFSAGILPWYLVCVNYYNFNNKLYALIIPQLMNPWFMFLLRNFFKSVPYELTESAKIDGAGFGTIFFKIILHISKPGLVTIAMFYALNYWNDWYLALMFIQKPKLYPLQYLLYNILSNVQFLSQNANLKMNINLQVPSETAKMAITCITIGPIILLYPFIQRFFVKGIIVGAVKG